MLLFSDAEPTDLGDRIVGCSSLYNIPVDVKRDIVFDEFSDIFTKSSSCVVLIQSVDVRVVLVVSGLHVVISATSVGLPLVGVSPGNSGFVDQVIHHAANAREYLAGVRVFLGGT